MLVMTVLCGLLGWLRLEMNRALDRREALKGLGLADSGMYYAHQHEGRTPLEPPPGPAWLRAILGDDLFVRVDWVLLNGVSLTEEQWRQFEKIETTRVMYFNDAPVRDEDLVHFEYFHSLEMLHLMRTQITDAGLVHLRGLSSLRDLDLWDTAVTEAGVRELQRFLPSCKISYGQPTKPQPTPLDAKVLEPIGP